MDPHVKILNLRTEMRMFDCLKKHFDPRLWKEARQAQGKYAVSGLAGANQELFATFIT